MSLEIARRLVDGVWRTGPVVEDSGAGGDPALLPRTEYRAVQTIPGGISFNPITWVVGPATGFEVLDLSGDATDPVVTVDGIYAVTAEVALNASGVPDRTGKHVVISLSLDYDTFGWLAQSVFDLDAGGGGLPVGGFGVGVVGSVSLTNFIPAGGSMVVWISHDAAGDLDFEYVISVQQIA
jgi:hypothetical protein